MGILTDLALTLGPAIVPLGGVGVASLTTLAGAGFTAATSAGTMAIAFQGVGDALKTMNEAHLEPTKENLQEARVAMERLAPAAQDFVRQIDSMRGLGASIRDAGAQALFPGLTEALDTIESRGPEVTRIVEAFNREVGDIASEGAESLASRRWDDFFRMVEREGPRTLDPLARAIGDVAHGASEIMEAFAPLNRDGMGWIASAADGFDRWATGLKRTEGFQDFVSYVRENGPQVAETLGSVANAGVKITEALAPLGGASLTAIEGIADALAGIADSGIGTELFAGFAAYRIARRVPGVGSLARGGLGRIGGGGVLGAAGGGVVPVFVTNPGFGGPGGGVPGVVGGGRSGVGRIARSLPFVGTALAVGAVARDEVNSPDYKPGLVGGGILGSGVNRSVAEISPVVDDAAAAKVRAEIEKITAKPYTASVELEDQRARRVAQGVHRMLDDVASQRPTPKIDADPAPATGKSNGVKRLLDEIGNKRPRPRIDANDNASPVINRVSGLLAGLDGRTANTTVTTTYVRQFVGGRSDTPGFGPDMEPSADGSTVPKGGTYRDKYPYLLAPGEEVISNRYGQADRHRALLKAINANRLADGGTARAIASAMRSSGSRGGSASVGFAAPSLSLAGARFVLEVPGMGQMATRVVRAELDAQDRWERVQARD